MTTNNSRADALTQAERNLLTRINDCTKPVSAEDRNGVIHLVERLAASPVEHHEAAPAGELGWRVRERRAPDGTLIDCFVEAPTDGEMPYALEVLGDDYTGYGGIERKYEHCKMIVGWANANRKPEPAAPYSAPFTTDVPQCCGEPETCSDPCDVQPEPPAADERAAFETLKGAWQSMPPFDVFCAGWRAARASSPNAAGAEPVAQWQSRLKDRSSPVVDHWVNISPDGAKTLMEKYANVYEVRALYAAPTSAPVGLTDEQRSTLESLALTSTPYEQEVLRSILAAHPGQPEPRASASVIAAAIAVIKAARAHVLTDEHIDALDIAIKIQQGMFKVPEPRDEVTPLRVERHSDMSVVVVFSSCRQASVFEKEILARTGAAHE